MARNKGKEAFKKHVKYWINEFKQYKKYECLN